MADGAPAGEQLDVSVVLPAYNEESLLETTVGALEEALAKTSYRAEIVIVENGSTDSTRAIAAELAAAHPVVSSQGLDVADYGEALRTGFLSARGDVVVNFDVDYWDIGFLDKSVRMIADGSAKVVLASKRAVGSTDRRPLVRRLLTAVFTRLMSSILSLPVTDAHGMKAFDRKALLDSVQQSTLRGPLFDVEVVLRAHRGGLAIAELPTEVVEIRPARTGLVRRSVSSLAGLLTLRRRLGPPR